MEALKTRISTTSSSLLMFSMTFQLGFLETLADLLSSFVWSSPSKSWTERVGEWTPESTYDADTILCAPEERSPMPNVCDIAILCSVSSWVSLKKDLRLLLLDNSGGGASRLFMFFELSITPLFFVESKSLSRLSLLLSSSGWPNLMIRNQDHVQGTSKLPILSGGFIWHNYCWLFWFLMPNQIDWEDQNQNNREKSSYNDIENHRFWGPFWEWSYY